jgi:hypothetical protein
MARILSLFAVVSAGVSLVTMSCASLHKSSIPQSNQALARPEALPIVDQASASASKVVSMARSFEQNGLLLTIRKVTVEAHAISVELTIQNPTNQILRFYPDQGTVLTGTSMLPANIFLSGSNLSGAFEPGEQQSGIVVFSAINESLNPAQIGTVQLALGRVLDMHTINPQDVQITLALN